MGRHSKTVAIIDAARTVLASLHPMTLRQIFYRLVANGVVENTDPKYDSVGRALVNARKDGDIPWEWIEDRLRRPRTVSMWSSLAAFAATAERAYRRDVWSTQENVVEVWLEKDALSGIFEDVLDPYGITLNVGRGYDGWSSIHEAAQRYGTGENVTVLYFGDFDPCGEDMFRSLEERLAFFQARSEMIKCALTSDDIEEYDLPPEPTKAGDTRREKHISKHGDRCVELDALPVDVLRQRITQEVESRMNLVALEAVKVVEEKDRKKLVKLLAGKGRTRR